MGVSPTFSSDKNPSPESSEPARVEILYSTCATQKLTSQIPELTFDAQFTLGDGPT